MTHAACRQRSNGQRHNGRRQPCLAGGLRAVAILAAALFGQLVSAQNVPAQTTAPIQITLDEAITRALAPVIASPRPGRVGAAAAAVVEERHAPQLPQVAGVGGYTRTNHVDEFGVLLPNNQLRIIYPDVPDNYRARLDVQWPLYTGGRLQAAETAARREHTAVGHELTSASDDLRLDVTRAFWNLVVGARVAARRRGVAGEDGGARA